MRQPCTFAFVASRFVAGIGHTTGLELDVPFQLDTSSPALCSASSSVVIVIIVAIVVVSKVAYILVEF